MTVSLIKLGEIAYQAYGESVGFKNYQGLPMPEWGNLTAAIQSAWIAAAVAVAKVPYSELNHLQAYEPISVLSCARCGKNHDINFMPFRGKAISDIDGDGFPVFYEFWGLRC